MALPRSMAKNGGYTDWGGTRQDKGFMDQLKRLQVLRVQAMAAEIYDHDLFMAVANADLMGEMLACHGIEHLATRLEQLAESVDAALQALPPKA